jgi:glutamyl-Q tRNA(Asp) synthetase
MIVTRFAPSPTGLLHLGHAHSALFGWRKARAAAGRFLLRIEDIDPGRCRPEFEAAILEDLLWLGLDWDGEVRRQSEHLAEYRVALDRLAALDLLYPCFCSRKDIAAAVSAPHGPEGPVYPGTCRSLAPEIATDRKARGDAYALRLDVAKAVRLSGPLSFRDEREGVLAARPELLGDVVLARRDAPASYHLCVALDDHLQGVTLVTRGTDLFHATHIHRLIQAVLALNVPAYAHHLLLTNAAGERLSKRDGAMSLAALRQAGRSPAEVRALAGFPGVGFPG